MIQRKTIVRLALSVAMAAGIGAGIARAETVRIATEADYAPFEFKDADGKLKGLEIELGDIYCKRAGLTCEWVNMDFDGMIPALGAHKIDAVLSQMSITPERAKVVAFTDVVTIAPAQFIAAKDSKITDDPATLKGKTIGVQSGTTHETYVNAKYKGIADIKVYQGQDEAFSDLQSGRIDATLCDQAIGYDWLTKTGKAAGYAQVGQPLTDPQIFGSGTGIAVRKDDTALLTAFNKAIASTLADGTFKKINDEYFPFSIAPK